MGLNRMNKGATGKTVEIENALMDMVNENVRIG